MVRFIVCQVCHAHTPVLPRADRRTLLQRLVAANDAHKAVCGGMK